MQLYASPGNHLQKAGVLIGMLLRRGIDVLLLKDPFFQKLYQINLNKRLVERVVLEAQTASNPLAREWKLKTSDDQLPQVRRFNRLRWFTKATIS